jgi:hypothetical protein
MSASGWKDFDGEIVDALHRRDPVAVDRTSSGGMRCPLSGHDDSLRWDDGDYRRGTPPHGTPAMRFRVSPTYILEDPLENFIAGRELVAQALKGEWQKAETGRLGYENSEDALSWNVFRSLQEAAQLGVAARVLAGVEFDGEPELILWGRSIGVDGTTPCLEIQRALDRLEPTHRQQTEPDVVLHVPGWGWIFIESKLSSPTATYAGKDGKLATWRRRYADPTPGLFDAAELDAAVPKSFPEQLLRNVAVAHAISEESERAVVVALVREQYATKVEGWGSRFLAANAPVEARSATWEQLYAALPPGEANLSGLRSYMENKSVGLRRAFALL